MAFGDRERLDDRESFLTTERKKKVVLSNEKKSVQFLPSY
jgi:hypothetical protein